jgi:hypothetical protein
MTEERDESPCSVPALRSEVTESVCVLQPEDSSLKSAHSKRGGQRRDASIRKRLEAMAKFESAH